MRLIDADTLIEIFCDRVARVSSRFGSDSSELGILMGAMKLVEVQPTVDLKPQWTLCSERMPEEDGKYIISGRWGSGKEAVGECDYSKADGYFATSWNFDPIAWMPFPNLYKEGDSE